MRADFWARAALSSKKTLYITIAVVIGRAGSVVTILDDRDRVIRCALDDALAIMRGEISLWSAALSGGTFATLAAPSSCRNQPVEQS